ncbi:6282_t:CDS:1, partial [Gigaspora rosea]
EIYTNASKKFWNEIMSPLEAMAECMYIHIKMETIKSITQIQRFQTLNFPLITRA